MTTAIEFLGQFHTNYEDYSVGENCPAGFKYCLLSILEKLENAPLMNGVAGSGLIHAVEADNESYTATIGFGLDINRYDRANFRDLLTYAFGGSAALTAKQTLGLDLLDSYKAGTTTWDAQDLASMASGQASSEWTVAQMEAIQSINLTKEQAEKMLDAMLFGNA
jgi:hypothetical protein